MRIYSIKDLEHLSGIKAHTIRIWEKRYKILSPKRTETNIRVYGNPELKKLLNVATLLNYGWKISDVSELEVSSLQKEVEKWIDGETSESHAAQVNTLVYHALAYDQLAFESLLDQALNKYGLKQTLLEIGYPFLKRIGMLWRVDQIIPAQEHFASNLLKRKLHVAISELPSPSESGDTYILFLPPNEHHEIGLLLAEYIVRSAGHKAIYLGADVPIPNVIDVGKTSKADFFCTFFITCRPQKQIMEAIQQLSDAFKDKQILISGCNKYFDGLELPENAAVVSSVQVLEAFV